MASGEIDVTPGRVLGPTELVDNAKLNDLGVPILRSKQGSITSRELADGSITSDKLDVTLEAQIGVADGSITTAKIVDDAVTAAKIADDLMTAQTSAATVNGADLMLWWDTVASTYRKQTFTAHLAQISGSLPTVLTGTATVDPPSLAPGDNYLFTVTVTGAATTNTPAVALGTSIALPDGFFMEARVSAANTVSVNLRNGSGGSQNIASHTVRAVVFQY